MISRRFAPGIAVAIGLVTRLARHVWILHYETCVQTWSPGSFSLGWGPFQLFYARVMPRPSGLPRLTMGMGTGVVLDPGLLALGAYRALMPGRLPATRAISFEVLPSLLAKACTTGLWANVGPRIAW